MKFITKFVELFHGGVRNISTEVPDIEAIRQNTPPNERDVEAAELNAVRDDTGGFGDASEAPRNTKSRAKKAGANN